MPSRTSSAPTRRALLRAAEARSMDAVQSATSASIDAFDHLGAIETKMALVREVVQTRAAELTRAHPNLKLVLAGFRSRDKDGRTYLHDEPCVVFAVERKWVGGQSPSAGQVELPRHLIVHVGAVGERIEVAVPTDVVDAAGLVGCRASARNIVRCEDGGFKETTGTIACEVRPNPASSVDAGKRWVMSALHVFSPFTADTAPDKELELRNGTQQAAGRTLKAGGTLRRDVAFVLDVQLAQIDHDAFDWLAAGGPAWELDPDEPFAADHASIDRRSTRLFRIVVSDDHPEAKGPRSIGARFFGWDTGSVGQVPITYNLRAASGGFDRVARFHHELLLLLIPASDGEKRSRVLPGDSGSPVLITSAAEKPMLAGMFIASEDRSDGSTLCCVLPAWAMFGINTWAHRPAGVASIRPTRAPA